MGSGPAGPASGPPPEPGRNVRLAIVTGLLLAGLVFATLFTSRPAFAILLVVVVLVALAEFYTTLSRHGFAPASGVGYAGAVVIMAGAFWRGASAITFGVTLAVMVSLLWYLVDPERKNVVANVAVTVLGIVWVPLMAAHVLLLRDLADGPAVTISYVGITALYDVAAFGVGSRFGRRKLAPAISPAKSWEGAIGASLFVLAVALSAGPHIGPFTMGSAAALAGVAMIVAPLGDLAESLMKRDLGIKDFGSLLPGHGGLLDRVDALLLMAPASYWLLRLVVR